MNIMFVGFGRSVFVQHLPFIKKNPNIHVVAVFDVNPAALKSAEDICGCRTYSVYEEALAAPDIDLVIILTRNDAHAQMTCDFLEAGKNVLITKPMARTPEEARRMIDAAQKSGKMLLPWLPCRWSSDLYALRELVASGAIGKVFMVRRSFCSFGRRSDWQTQQAYGGGYILNWGPHLVDHPMELLGERAASVYGVKKRCINPGDAEDMFFAVMQSESGVTMISEYGIATDIYYDWIIQGDKGTITVKGDDIIVESVTQPEAIDVTQYRGEVEVTRTRVEGYSSENSFGDLDEVYRHIEAVVSGREQYMVSLDSAYHLIEVLDAIRRSAESGETIHLNKV